MVLMAPWGVKAQSFSLTEYELTTDVTTFNSIVSTGTQLTFLDNDDGYATVTLPFDFIYGKSSFASGAKIACSANGFMYLGENSTSGITGSYSAYRAVNAFLAEDGHIGHYTGDDPSGAWYLYDANAGTLTIEYHRLGSYNSPYGDYTYQVVFHNNGDIEFIYGVIDHGTATSRIMTTYLTDGPNSDEVFVTGEWALPTKSTTYSTRPFSPVPVEGLRYTFTRPVNTCFKPQNLAATLTLGDGTIATLTWERNAHGTEDAWVLEYGTAANFEGATSVNVTGGTPSKDLTGLTAEQKYYARVKPDCDTEGNLWSNAINFTPTDAYAITVYANGTNSETSTVIPMSGKFFDYYTKSECIIPASELGAMQWGQITSITFYAKTVDTHSSTWANTNQKVFVKEVNSTTLGGSYSGMDGATIVFDGLLPMPTTSTDGYTITFSQPYTYSGGNLLIGVYNDDDGSFNSVTWYGKTLLSTKKST